MLYHFVCEKGCLSQRVFDVAVHTMVDKKGHRHRTHFGVDGEVDFLVIEGIVDGKENLGGSMKELFPDFMRRLSCREKLLEAIEVGDGSAIRALMVLGVLALLNIEDTSASADMEVIPFLTEVREADDWQNVIYQLGLLMLGNTEK